MKKWILFAFAMVYAFAMAGCSQNQADQDSVFGSWEAEMELSVLGVSAAEEEGKKTAAAMYCFDFFEDGTGESRIILDEKYAGHIPNTKEHFTYVLDGDKLTLTYETGRVQEFTVSFSDGKLILDGRARIELVPQKQ